MYARGKGIEFLVDDGRRGSNEHTRLLPGLEVKFVQQGVESFAALFFEVGGLACGQMPQVGDHIFPHRQTVFAQCPAHERLEDLLGAPPSDAEHGLERGAVDEGMRQMFEQPDDLVEAIVPERFIGQGGPRNFTKG
jgi:hypothetical protein